MSEVTPDCLDAETLAAWMDDGLPAAALETARAHVAGCARCQALVATMVRLEPPAAAAAAPAPSRWWMTWLLPVAGAAAAVTVWFAVAQRTPSTPPLEEQSKQAAATAPAMPAPVAPPALAEPTPKTFADESSKRDMAKLSKEQRSNTAAKNELPPRSREDKDAKKKAEAAPPAAAAAPPAAPPVAAEAKAGVAVVQQVPKPAAPQVLDRLAFAGLADVRSPDAAVRWRVSNGRIDQSTDAGSTWTAQHTLAAGATVIAGSSPSRDVCWLVGPNGLVLLTPDGRTWQTLTFPEPAVLVSVTATDAVSAVVRTADGREFVTKDAGKSWVRRPLQDF